MVSQELVNYVIQARQQGFSDQQIITELQSRNWTQQDIDLALSSNKTPHLPNLFSFKQILFLVIPVVLVLLAFFLLLFIQRKNTKNQQNLTQVIPTKQNNKSVGSIGQLLNKSNHPVVFVIRHKDNYEVVFYDVTTNQTLKSFPELKESLNIISFGNWSADGKYLPIFVENFSEPGKPTNIAFYFYRAYDHKLLSAYESNERSSDNELMEHFVVWNSSWLSNEKFAYDLFDDFENPSKGKEANWIDINGKRGQDILPITRKYVYIDYKTQSILADQKWIKNFIINNKTIPIPEDRHTIDVVGEHILLLAVPPTGNLVDPNQPGYIDVNKKTEELTAQGKTPEEIGKILLDLAEPKDPSIIEFLNINTNSIDKTVTITDGSWQVSSIQLLSGNKKGIVHLIDKRFMTTKEQFIEFDVNDPTKQTVLLERPVLNYDNGSASGFMELGRSFEIIDQGSGNYLLVLYHNDFKDLTDPLVIGSGISIYNSSTKKSFSICKSSCLDVRVYNPKTGYYLSE